MYYIYVYYVCILLAQIPIYIYPYHIYYMCVHFIQKYRFYYIVDLPQTTF